MTRNGWGWCSGGDRAELYLHGPGDYMVICVCQNFLNCTQQRMDFALSKSSIKLKNEKKIVRVRSANRGSI